ncbi:MAG: ribosome silencing factor [Planctomycetota bacterium]|nr:ribosome silencing factor [Planctomycetota bacterium]MDP6519135.1 ribosome silencing factor [Planctomycetota bacterium]MDP6837894.1 ribosome silencing factor [Planctomycetota bacterium]
MLAAAAAQLADAKKGCDIRAYDVSEHIRVADYFLVITGTSRPHVKALQNELHVRLKALGEQPITEGAALGWWILIDFGDVVVHILQEEAREYYDLDHLYGECPQLDWRAIEVGEIPEIPPRVRELEFAAELEATGDVLETADSELDAESDLESGLESEALVE